MLPVQREKMESGTMEEKKVKQRYRNGYPVRDARLPLTLVVSSDDIVDGVPAEKGCCALANCCFRSFCSPHMEVLKGFAFVALPDEITGEFWLERYELRSKTKELIQSFDSGGNVKPGLYVFDIPSDGEKLDSPIKKANNRRYAEYRHTEKRKKGRQGSKVKQTVFSRNAPGKFHYSTKPVASKHQVKQPEPKAKKEGGK